MKGYIYLDNTVPEEPLLLVKYQLIPLAYYLYSVPEFKDAEDQLLEPEINIMLGSWYLASLKREFNNNEVLMLAAYNAGRGNVNEWMKQYDWHGDFAKIEEIPFPETKNSPI